MSAYYWKRCQTYIT